MKDHIYEKFDASDLTFDEFDKFEFEEQDDLREFFEDSDARDLV